MHCKSYADFKLISLNVTHLTQIIQNFTLCLNSFFVFVFQLVSISVYDCFYYLLLLFLWLFPSSGVAAMVVDHLFPVRPVSFIALSQSYSLHVPLAHILPPCLWSPSLPFPRYRFRHHSLHYVIFFHPHDVPTVSIILT